MLPIVGGASFQGPYPWDGFLATFENPPALNATHSKGVQTFWWRMGGNYGLDILADGSPESRQIDCTTKAPIGQMEPTATPRWSSLSYQAHTGRYSYPWQPPAGNNYAGTCREFVLTLDDGSVHSAYLRFVK